jgi:hypothetical protein
MRGWMVAVLLVSTSAAAEPLIARNASDVRIAVAGKARHALALKPLPAGGGWRLELAADASAADIVDVTPGTPARTITVAVLGRTLRFDGVRFAGGHVYDVRLRAAGKTPSGFIYLYPAPAAKEKPRKGAERVRFDVDEAPAADDAIAPIDKGPL